MAQTEIGDPRLQALFGASDPRDAGVRPTVRLRKTGLPPLVLAGAALLFAVVLFVVLDSRRTASPGPAVQGRGAEVAPSVWDAPPPLYIPPVPAPVTVPAQVEKPEAAPSPVVVPVPVAAPRPAPAPIVYAPPPIPIAPPPIQTAPSRVSSGSPLVIDTGVAAAGGQSAAGDGAGILGAVPRNAGRMRASGLANRSMTVPQGHLIPAVLETGFDSTKPGFARAVVSRDVRGFDGKTVLIPRGSKLVGEYRSNIAPGQNRAMISWTRLVRPDGMTIAMDSPAVDTLGRGGVRASVNTHFFGRLGDALLQSTFEIGRTFAGRALTGPVVVLPNAAAGVAAPQVSSGTNYVPTLTVPPGRSISVFVAHDLDFSAAGPGR